MGNREEHFDSTKLGEVTDVVDDHWVADFQSAYGFDASESHAENVRFYGSYTL